MPQFISEIPKNIHREWEILLFALTLSGLFAYMMILFLGLGEKRLPNLGDEVLRNKRGFLNSDTAWVFLNPEESLTREFNPFAFSFKYDAATPIQETVKAEPSPPPTVMPPEKAPKPEKKRTALKYQGMIRVGTALAFVETVETGEVKSLKAGEMMNGFKIISFDNAFLNVLTPNGENARIALGEERQFEIEND